MICKLLVACLALVPVTILAEKFYLGGCGDFTSLLDGNAGTQQGLNMLAKFFAKGDGIAMYLWDPSPIESTQYCNLIESSFKDGVVPFTYLINGFSKAYIGMIKPVISPNPRLEVNGTLPEGVLGANSKGQAYWFPVYISTTDLVVIACRNTPFGRRETIYVLSTQIYGAIDIKCAADAVSTAIKKKVYAMPSYSAESPKCRT